MSIQKKINFLFHKILFDFFFQILHFLYNSIAQRKSDKILVISLNYLGDVFMATPAINALKKLHPELEIDVLIKKANNQVVQYNAQISNIYFDYSSYSKTSNTFISFAKMIMANYCVFFLLFKQNYDVIFDFTGSFESAFICALIGKKRRYGISWRPHFRNAFDEVVDGYSKPQHLSNLNCDLVRKAGYNIKQKDCKYLLDIPEDIDNWAKSIVSSFETEKVVTLAPFAGWKQKEWNITNFLTLSSRLSSLNSTVIFIGSKSEADKLRPYEDHFNFHILNYCGKTSLIHSAALIKHSDLFIGLDSSQSHFADALHTPSVVIFGPTNPIYHQIGSNPFVKVIYKQFNCSCHEHQKYCHENCFTFICPESHQCMEAISVDEVFDAAINLLQSKVTERANGDSVHA